MKGLRDAHAHRQSPGRGLASWYIPGRSDGFGDRLLMFDNSGTASLELLRFREALAKTPGFEKQLRERVRLLQGLHHHAFAAIRAVQHLDDEEGLTLVSEHAEGQRLSELFQRRPRKGVEADIVAWFIREMTPALAALQSLGPDVAHGALTPDRIVLTPGGHLSIVEHALGSALQGLELDQPTLWRDFGVAAPASESGSAPRIDARADVLQLASVALSMLLGRPLTQQDLQDHLPRLLDEVARSQSSSASSAPVAEPLRRWLARALQVDAQPYGSASDAQSDLDDLRPQTRSRTLGPASVPTRMHEGSGDTGIATIEPVPAGRTMLRPVPRSQEPRNMRHQPPLSDIADSFPSESIEEPTVMTEHAHEPADTEIKALRARLVQESAHDPEPELDIPMPLAAAQPDEPAPKLAPPLAIAPPRFVRSRWPRTVNSGIAAGLAALVVAEAAVIGVLATRKTAAPAASPLMVESLQPGDTVLINGKPVGSTPIQIAVGGDTRSLRVLSAAPPSFEGAAAASPAPPVVEAPAPRAAATLPEPAPPKQGGMRLQSPIELTVLQGDRVLGSTADPIFLSVGTHQVQLVNNALGFKATQSVTIRGGQIGTQRVDIPNGRLNLNAQPWARVAVDGVDKGETPLANVAVPIGDHEIVFRHPQLGEKRERVTVRADSVIRVTANLDR